MDMSVRLTALAFLIAVPFGFVRGDEQKVAPLTEHRRHLELRAKDGTRLYEWTEILRLSDRRTENHMPVRDEGHGDFVLHHISSFETQTTQYRISDVKDRAFLQLSFKLPTTSKTLAETLTETRDNAGLMDARTVVKVETNGGVWEDIESRGEELIELRALRHTIRGTLDRFLLEAIERGRGLLFSTSEASAFYLMLRGYIVYDTRGHEQAIDDDGVVSLEAPPNCAFDAALGYPCSDEQKERIKRLLSKAAHSTGIESAAHAQRSRHVRPVERPPRCGHRSPRASRRARTARPPPDRRPSRYVFAATLLRNQPAGRKATYRRRGRLRSPICRL